MIRRLDLAALTAVTGVGAAALSVGLALPMASAAPRPIEVGAEIEAVDDAGRPLRFRIDSIEKDPRDAEKEVSLYGVSVRDAASGAWAPYCAPDREGKSRAAVVRGSWDASGTYVEGSEDKITFACTSGAIGKCVRFGYKPWKSVNGVSLRPHHQACIRMVRADYCGDGRPHTKDGTMIDMWDHVGIQAREEREGHPEVFEAAWGPDGAVYLSIPRWSDEVATIVAECPEKLRGRTSLDEVLSPPEAAVRHREALLFNGRYLRDEDRMPPR